MKRHLSSIVLVLVFLTGLLVLLYPTISDYVNSRHQTEAIAEYMETASSYSQEQTDAAFAAADAYNQELAQTPGAFLDPSLVDGYEQTLDVSGTGIMGVITIDKIGVELPIYHTTDDSVLQVAVGHLEGTSLPVGGSGTHCVLTGHRGLPSAKLFTELDKMEVGDTFTITVLGKVLTYEVDQIKIVEPEDVQDLQTEDGKDYCTLVTCTPYGINTQRILVRGMRVATASTGDYVAQEAGFIDPLLAAQVIAVPILVVLLVFLLVRYRRRRGRGNADEK